MIYRFLPESDEGLRRCRQLGIRYSCLFLQVNIARQRMNLYRKLPNVHKERKYEFCGEYLISTSRYGIGSLEGSKKTPLGLHRIARKVGGGWPQGTVFKGRVPVGAVWAGMPQAKIAHRILWLEGLEAGFNQGDEVDTFKRYIYIHGIGEELTLGRPSSCGCIHLAAADLMPLYENCAEGDLVWIEER